MYLSTIRKIMVNFYDKDSLLKPLYLYVINFYQSNRVLDFYWKIKQRLSNTLEIYKYVNRLLFYRVAYKTE